MNERLPVYTAFVDHSQLFMIIFYYFKKNMLFYGHMNDKFLRIG